MTRWSGHELALGVIACGLLVGPANAQRLVASAARSSGAWQEAAIVAQGADSQAFLDSAAVAEVMRVLARVRQAVPALDSVRAEGEFWAADLFVDATLAEQLRRRGRPVRQGSYFERWLLRDTGVPALDSLDARFAVDSLTLWSGSSAGDRVNPVIRVVFRYAMNLPAVLAAYEGVPGIRAATPRRDVGPQTGHTYRLERSAGGWQLRIEQGIGDCAAGCTSWVRWKLLVRAGGGTVEVVGRDSGTAR